MASASGDIDAQQKELGFMESLVMVCVAPQTSRGDWLHGYNPLEQESKALEEKIEVDSSKIQELRGQLHSLMPNADKDSAEKGLVEVKVREHEDKDDEEGLGLRAQFHPRQPALRVYHTNYDQLVKTTIRNLGEESLTLTPVYYHVKMNVRETETQGDLLLKSGEEAEMQFPVQLNESEGETMTGWEFLTAQGVLVLNVMVKPNALQSSTDGYLSSSHFCSGPLMKATQEELTQFEQTGQFTDFQRAKFLLCEYTTRSKCTSVGRRRRSATTRSARPAKKPRLSLCSSTPVAAKELLPPAQQGSIDQSFLNGLWCLLPVQNGNADEGRNVVPIVIKDTAPEGEALADLSCSMDNYGGVTLLHCCLAGPVEPGTEYLLACNVDKTCTEHPLDGTLAGGVVVMPYLAALHHLEQHGEHDKRLEEAFREQLEQYFQWTVGVGRSEHIHKGVQYDCKGMCKFNKETKKLNVTDPRSIVFRGSTTTASTATSTNELGEEEKQWVVKSGGHTVSAYGGAAPTFRDKHVNNKPALSPGRMHVTVVATGGLLPVVLPKENDCLVCLEPCERGSKITLGYQCRHPICAGCHKRWGKTCPACRAPPRRDPCTFTLLD